MQNETCLRGLIRASLLDEVYTTPKPGLVDLHDNGAHTDMDVPLFERSTDAIVPFFYAMYEEGERFVRNQAGDLPDTDRSDVFAALFLRVREMGKEAERVMFRATKNVNTHKGMIFSMGLLLTAAGTLTPPAVHRADNETMRTDESETRTKYPAQDAVYLTPRALCERASTIASFVIGRELSREECAPAREQAAPVQSGTHIPETHGEAVRRRFQVDGVRGEALSGFPTLLHTALPALSKAKEEGLSDNDARVQTLLSVMAVLEDTNVYARGGSSAADFVKKQAKKILETETPGSIPWKGALARFNEELIRDNLSPGGAADMLALALLVERLCGNP